MSIGSTQLPEAYKIVIDGQIALFEKVPGITIVNEIPDTTKIPLAEEKNNWLRIPDVICVFVDMLGSTKLSATTEDKLTARVFQLFTGTAVRLFDAFESPYIDVRGDGVFALFNGDMKYRALAAAVSFKTFAKEEFVPRVKADLKKDVGCHIGIDQKTVLVKKIGLKKIEGRTDRQNEVWAGKPVNMAAKLASLTKDGELLVSDRFYDKISNAKARISCGCPGGEKKALWKTHDLTGDSKFDFDTAYVLESVWCGTHGKEYCEAILDLDEDDN